MKHKNHLLTSFIFVLVLFTACSHPVPKVVSSKSTQMEDVRLKTNGSYYTILEFDKGKSSLTDHNKEELKEFLAKAQEDGKPVNDIKILAWADKDYEGEGKPEKDDVKVADKRTEVIEKYLKDDLNADAGLAAYNMAKRPDRIDKFLHSEDSRVKKVFEKTGSLPTDEGGDLSSLLEAKASKALIMVDYE
jgi:hypothetical protein